MLVGDICPTTQLWRLPINPAKKPTATSCTATMDLHLYPGQADNHQAYNVYTIPHKQNQLKYMHQSFLNAPIPTILTAIKNGHLDGIPLMKTELINKYLARSAVTSKGRMKRPRSGIRSTRKKGPTKRPGVTEISPIEAINESRPHEIRTSEQHVSRILDDYESCEGANNLFCYAALADTIKGTLYTDATGALPARSLDGNQYYFVAYDYDTNYIFAIPLKDLTNTSIIKGFDKVFSQMKDKGYKP